MEEVSPLILTFDQLKAIKKAIQLISQNNMNGRFKPVFAIKHLRAILASYQEDDEWL